MSALAELAMRCTRCSLAWLRVTAVRPPLLPDRCCPYCGAHDVKVRRS